MDKIRTGLRRIRYYLKRDYLTVENIVLMTALVLCASWTWAAVSTMSKNWELEQGLQESILTKARTELQVEKLKLEQEYYLTDEYKELTARAKLGKMAEGESMLVLPDNSEGAKNKYNDADTKIVPKKSNFEEWVSFLFS